jgi:hypothetical protein
LDATTPAEVWVLTEAASVRRVLSISMRVKLRRQKVPTEEAETLNPWRLSVMAICS